MELRLKEDELKIGITPSEKVLQQSTSVLDQGQFDVVGKKSRSVGLSDLQVSFRHVRACAHT